MPFRPLNPDKDMQLNTDNQSFGMAAFSLPGRSARMLFKGSISGLTDNTILKEGKPGFVMAPFGKELPVLWLEAEDIQEITHLSRSDLIAGAESPSGIQGQRIHQADRDEYLTQVAHIRDLINAGQAGKVVLSRQILIPATGAHKPAALFNMLCDLYPDAFVYLAAFPGYGTWAGATPETLIRFRESSIRTMALAGTRAMQSGTEWSAKEQDEHAIVSRYIVDHLQQQGCTGITATSPYTVKAGRLEHLRTDITALSNIQQMPSVVNALHPTPAVCGLPTLNAEAVIRQTEKHDRTYYTGYLGPVWAGEISLFVNLRCMQMINDGVLVYVGGGLTALSDPAAEWEETRLKSTTLLPVIEKMQNLAD